MIELVQGDITKIHVDAIVNAANASLLGGGGVDGAIHRAGGPSILEKCEEIRRKQGGCKTGEAVLTTAGRLPAKFVVHTVGPIWKNGRHDEAAVLLASAYTKSLELAAANGARSISFPNISTGVYAFPKEQAAPIAIKAVRNFLAKDERVDKVIFVCYDEENYQLYQQLLNENG